MKQVFISSSSYSHYCEKPICTYLRCTCSHTAGTRKCWKLPGHFRGSYVRKLEYSHCNLVNRIIKITHTHTLHLKMLDFYISTRLLCPNDFNKSPPFLTSAIKLWIIHYFSSNRMIVKLLKYRFLLISCYSTQWNNLKLFRQLHGYFQVSSLTQKLPMFT